MQVHLIDDESIILDAASFLLEQAGYKSICWNDSRLFIEQAELHKVGVVILDMKMPHYDGSQVHQYLIDNDSTLAVIIMTAHADVPMAVKELKKGAIDFLQKPIDFESLQKALDAAQIKSEQAYEKYIVQQKFNKLSEKEKEVLKFILEGKINKQIADLCHISVRTVEVHRSNISEKMEAKNIADLVAQVSLL